MKNRRNYFFENLIMYAGLWLVLLVCAFLISHVASKAVLRNVISEGELNLNNGSLNFEQKILSLRSVAEKMYVNESLRILSDEEEYLEVYNYVEMNYAMEQFKSYRMIGDLPYGFVLFRDNSVYLSDMQVSHDFAEYYGNFMQADTMSAGEFKEFVFEEEGAISFVALDSFQYYDERVVVHENPILAVVRAVGKSGKTIDDWCFVFVLPQEEVLDFFLTDDIKGNGIAYIYDNLGNVLLEYGAPEIVDIGNIAEEYRLEKETYRFIQTNTAEGILRVYVGISESVVGEKIAYLLRGIKIIMVAAIMYTVLAVVFMAWRRTKIHKDYSQLKQELNNNILANVLSHGVISEEDKEKLEAILDYRLDYYYVIVFYSKEINQENLYPVTECLIESFCEIFGQYLYELHLDLSEEVFLVRQSEKDDIDLDRIERELKSIANKVTKQTDVVFSVGVSGIGRGIDYMNTCYEQARQTHIYIRCEHENAVGCYPKIKRDIGNDSIEFEHLYKIYNMILMGNKAAVEKTLDRLVRICEKTGGEQNGRELFYSLSCIVSDAYAKLGMEEKLQKSFHWNSRSGLRNQITEIKDHIFLLIDSYEKNKRSHNSELKDKIIRFLEENYQNPNLTAAEVCEAIHISESYLTRFLREQTLKSFVKYLEEIRLKKAKEYLIYTDWNNKKIAEEVGFGSTNTFYRVFNKAEGETPANWKKAYMSNRDVLEKGD